MSITPEMLWSRLANTTETTDSITSTAQWILFHKRRADLIAHEWAKFLTSQSNKLSPIYIANEVIQQSKIKRKGEFVDAFAPVLPEALAAAYSVSDLATRDRIMRVIKVWRDRSIFSSHDQQEIENVVSDKGPEVAPELKGLLRLFSNLKQKPSKEASDLVKEELKRLASVTDSILETPAVQQQEPMPRDVRYTALDALKTDSSRPDDDDHMESDGGVGYASDDELENPDAKRQKV